MSVPSRGRHKLEQAFQAFRAQVEGETAIDIGSSHGGFSGLLLEKGVRRLYCIDVAYGILDYNVRRNERVTALERKNVRSISGDWFGDEAFPGGSVFVTCDVSFMSVRTVLAALARFLDERGLSMRGFFLVKPQFEDSKATEKGVVKDEAVRTALIDQAARSAQEAGYQLLGRADIQPEKGKNIETFLYLSRIKGGSYSPGQGPRSQS